MALRYVCTSCGFYGAGKTAIKGNGAIEIILWLCFLIPGLIYSIWRSTSRHKVCPMCKNATLVPDHTPIGRKMIREYNIDTSIVPVDEGTLIGWLKQNWIITAILVGLFVIPVFMALVSY